MIKRYSLKPLQFCASAIAVSLLMPSVFIGCGNSPSRADLSWIEPVQLASGEELKVRRHVIVRQERAFGGGFASAAVYDTSTVSLDPSIPQFPVWNAPIVPIYLDKDPGTAEWIIIASSDSCDIWLRNGRPRPPYWAFRLRDGAWLRDAIPKEFIGRKANLFVGLQVTDDSEELSGELRTNKAEFAAKRKSAPQYKAVFSNFPDIENCGSARETRPIGENELDLKKFEKAAQ
jgi:hypothetical protein